MREITYKTTPLTLTDFVLMDRIKAGVTTYEAIVALIVKRTDLAEEEVLRMEMDEGPPIIAKAMEHAITLEAIGKSLG